MGLYKRQDSGIWWMSFAANGKLYRRSTETADRKLADKVWAKVQTMLVEGRWFDVDQARQHTFEEMMERFLKEHGPTVSSSMQRSYRVTLKHLQPFFGGNYLDKIDTDMVLRYQTHRRTDPKCGPATRNRELGMLRKAFNLARLWKWAKENPCHFVKREKEPTDIGRALTLDEEERLLKTAQGLCNGCLPDMIVFALQTGVRQGQVINLAWDKIDMVNRTIETFNEKARRWYTLPMTDTVFEMLQRRSKVRSITGYVFTTRNGTPFEARNLRDDFYRARNKAGITRFRWHDMRHTVGRRITQGGRDIYAAASVLNHSQLSTAMRYAKHNVESLRDVVRTLDKKASSNG